MTHLCYVGDVFFPVLQFAYEVVSNLAVVTVEVERVVMAVQSTVLSVTKHQ